MYVFFLLLKSISIFNHFLRFFKILNLCIYICYDKIIKKCYKNKNMNIIFILKYNI